MPTYDKATGNAGTLRIVDTGSAVEFWILCSDSATNVGSLTWSGNVNGAGVGGTTSFPAGTGSKRVGTWTVSTAQTVTFHMNATGTQGLGGPTDHSAGITRGGVPGTPAAPVVSAITGTGAKFTWAAVAGNGSTPNYGLYVSTKADFSSHVFAKWLGNVLTYTLTDELSPAAHYYTRVRAQNASGVGAYGPAAQFDTISGAYVSDGTVWKPAPVYVDDGTTATPATVLVSDGTTWKPVG